MRKTMMAALAAMTLFTGTANAETKCEAATDMAAKMEAAGQLLFQKFTFTKKYAETNDSLSAAKYAVKLESLLEAFVDEAIAFNSSRDAQCGAKKVM